MTRVVRRGHPGGRLGILVDAPTLNPGQGGIGTYSVALIRAVTARLSFFRRRDERRKASD